MKDTPVSVRLDATLSTLFGVTLMAVLGVSSITPAFPLIVRELGITPGQVGLLVSVFTIPGVLFSPVAGVLADRLGRRRVLAPALFLFGLAGAACGFSGSFSVLLALRFFQGVGASALGVLVPTIISDIYDGWERTVALGYNASVLSIGTASYPIAGGALAMIGWRYPFMLPIFALPIGLAVIFRMRNPEPENHQPFGLYIRSAAGTLRSPRVAGLFIIGIMSFVILYGSYLTYLPFLLDKRFGSSSFVIGLIMSTTSISTALVSSRIGFFVRQCGENRLLGVGFALYGIGMLLMPFMPVAGMFVLPTAIYGAGMGLNNPCIQSLLGAQAPREHRAAFMSLFSMMLRIGQTIGPLVMGMVYMCCGVDAVFYAGAICAAVMVAVTVSLVR